MGSRLRLALAVLAGTVLAGCSGAPTTQVARSAGSLGISPDGRTLYAANFDTGTVSVIDAETFRVTAKVTVGANPSRIAVAKDGRVFVSDRGSRAVSVIDPKTDTVTETIPVGAEPIGLALSKDDGTLFVACFTGSEVVAVDTKTGRTLWTAPVDHARGVAVAGSRLLVTAFTRGTVSILDPATGKRSLAPVNLDQNPLTMQSRVGAPEDAEQATAIVVAPKADRAFVLDVEARDAAVATTVPGAYGSPPGSTRKVAVVAAGVSTLDLASTTLVRPDPNDATKSGSPDGTPVPVSGPGIGLTSHLPGTPPPGSPDAKTIPPPVLASDGSVVMNAPSAAILGPSGQFLYVVFQGSDDLAVVEAKGTGPFTDAYPGIWTVAATGGQFPTGIALSADGKRLFVHDAHSYTVSEIVRNQGPTAAMDRLRIARLVTVASAPGWLTPEIAAGRRLFYSATNRSVTNTSDGGISCASCHPEGRDDGRTWEFTEGPRNTPFLATGFLAKTAPFHWAGEISSFDGFQQIVQTRMGGSGLSAQQFADIMAFLQSKAVLHPDNPNLAPDGKLTALQSEGKALFDGQAGCNVCHKGATTTDNLNHDVGTFTELTDPATGTTVVDMTHAIQTPTLHDVFTSGPYLHNGAAQTITQRLVAFPGGSGGSVAHGNVSGLTDHQMTALVAYVKTL